MKLILNIFRSGGTFMFLLLLSINTNVFAQHVYKPCGTSFSAANINLIKSLPLSPVPSEFEGGVMKSSVDDVNIQFHIVCSGNIATAPVSLAQVNAALNVLNTKFAPAGINFVPCSAPRYILFSAYDNFPFADTLAETALGKSDVPNTINIYIMREISGGDYGAYTYFLGSSSRIFLAASGPFDESTHLENGLVLTHEMGHFFGLLHTNGSSQPGTTTELVNGTNSLNAGDFVQDTPADPGSLSHMMVDQNGTTTYPFLPFPDPCNPPQSFPPFCDANHQVYQPLGNNLMIFTYRISFNTLTPKQAQKIYSTYIAHYANSFKGGFDLVSKDHPEDAGYEPIQSTDWIWVYQSPDIWNCRNPNSCTSHQEPGYANNATTNNYLRVKVRNNGCAPSQQATIHAYWTLAATGEVWPASWTTQTICGLPGGGEISNSDGTFGQNIPMLVPNQEVIMTFPWKPIDPTPYTCILQLPNGDPNLNLCLLSRIVSSGDPMYSENTGPVDHNIRYNNNIVTRNTRLVNLSGSKPGRSFGDGGNILVQNSLEEGKVFDLHIVNKQLNDPYFDFGGAVITLSEGLWERWIIGGQKGTGVTVFNYSLHQIAITGNNAVLEDIFMAPQETESATLEFYLSKTCPTLSRHDFALYQTEESQDGIIGSACIFEVNITGNATPASGNIGGAVHNLNDNSLVLYPNPVTGRNAIIEFSLPDESKADIFITDAWGRKLCQVAKSKTYPSGINKESIDLTGYANGVYFLEMVNATNVQRITFAITQ
jgi:hypothetical protein